MKLTTKNLLKIIGRVPFYLLGVLVGSLGLWVIFFQFDVKTLDDVTYYGKQSLYMGLFKMIGTGFGSWGIGLFLILLGYFNTYTVLTNLYENVEYLYENEYHYNKRVMYVNILVYTILCFFFSLVTIFI
jgi:hypothetical protein